MYSSVDGLKAVQSCFGKGSTQFQGRYASIAVRMRRRRRRRRKGIYNGDDDRTGIR
jgi:hypothetical protein